MNRIFYILPLFLLSACAEAVVSSQHVEEVDGNQLRFTSGSTDGVGRFVTVDNVNKHWSGPLAGGKEKWQKRANLLNGYATQEIRRICGEWFYQSIKPPTYNMMDKDDTMGGMAPVLGISASMIAHLAADSATDPANVPVSIHSEFRCSKDEQ